jgi:osmotically-inducible protein OsmY
MTKSKHFRVMGFTLLLIGLVSGCAAERTFAEDPEDAKLTANVEQLFAQHPDLGPPNMIYVRSREHVVYLSGVVDTGLVTENAEAIARQVPGVARVESTVSVDK